MEIQYFAGDQVSILVSDYVAGGSLLDLANMYKLKSGKTMKQPLVVYFALQMLEIVQAMHECFFMPDNSVALQLIDFGCSIDMTLFPPNTTFTRRVTTENFVCCEMLDERPWSYHTDLFCIAATVHVLLFDTYIKLRKQDGLWSITQRDLLNQQCGPANLAPIMSMLAESLKGGDLYTEIRYIMNLLKNR
ncbi:hypothetical protein NQ318_011072 [Aromia moschata]|uniref:Protein kinase domain-containing protein n=1 Tax=Aromia moschata TaxID=1265417 RepID=A0AAV8YS74_9CUCU|nr:hypothetical protein NQ318_011072 [Aromia moschata]